MAPRRSFPSLETPTPRPSRARPAPSATTAPTDRPPFPPAHSASATGSHGKAAGDRERAQPERDAEGPALARRRVHAPLPSRNWIERRKLERAGIVAGGRQPPRVFSAGHRDRLTVE